MKRILFALAAIATLVAAASCDKKEEKPVDITVQLSLDDANYAVAGIKVALADAAGTATFEESTDASGAVAFTVPAGMYTASTAFKNAENGVLKTFSGSLNLTVVASTPETYTIKLNKVEASQIIIKELYTAGCPKNDGSGSYTNDAYVTLYNNTDVEADASEICFGIIQPGNAHAVNKWLADGALAYENAGYIPCYSAIWYFQSPVKIAPYSSLTVAIFGAIDHTQTYTYSVDLSKPEYYVMAKEGITQITNAKYQIADGIDKSHYLTAQFFNLGNAWVLSNSSPGFFIGKMTDAEITALVADTEAYDITGGTTNVGWAPKFPTANIVDAIDCWDASKIESSNLRFPATINTGYNALVTKKGHTHYRNVDADATKALPENEGKLVTGYDADPSGIDAEASIKAGAHIIYSDTNASDKDFHERAESALRQ